MYVPHRQIGMKIAPFFLCYFAFMFSSSLSLILPVSFFLSWTCEGDRSMWPFFSYGLANFRNCYFHSGLHRWSARASYKNTKQERKKKQSIGDTTICTNACTISTHLRSDTSAHQECTEEQRNELSEYFVDNMTRKSRWNVNGSITIDWLLFAVEELWSICRFSFLYWSVYYPATRSSIRSASFYFHFLVVSSWES